MSFSKEIKEEICEAKTIGELRHCRLAFLSALRVLKEYEINNHLLRRPCCKKRFIAGVFLACGSISDPEKSYHLEFVFLNEKFSRDFSSLLNSFELNSKSIARKSYYVAYVKEGDKIADFLKVVSAGEGLMKFENIRILKDIRNQTNREVNCETENIRKTVNAAAGHIENIRLIENSPALERLPQDLYELARLRVSLPDASLAELGKASGLSKASVNYKFKRLEKIAEKIRGGKYFERIRN
jgi:DNA-binding protein WhiA